MSLRVFRHVDEQSSHSSWQPLLSHSSRLFQIRPRQPSHPRRAMRERRNEFRKQLVARCARIEFGPQMSHLLLTKILPLGICQQTIQAARQVPNMKRNRRRSRRPGIHFSI